MALPPKQALTFAETVELLSKLTNDECDKTLLWDYLIQGRLSICIYIETAVCWIEFDPDVNYDPVNCISRYASLNYLRFPNDQEYAYVDPLDLPKHYTLWFPICSLFMEPKVDSTQVDISKTYCLIDRELASMADRPWAASPWLLENSNEAFFLRTEIEKFIEDQGVTDTDESGKVDSPTTQNERELMLAGWIAGKGGTTDMSELGLTQEELWDELHKASKGLFPPSSKDTIKKFFNKQNLVSFKKGRPKSN